MPSGTSRSTPARAVVDPNRLTTPATLTAGGRLPPDPLVSGCSIAAVRTLLVVETASRDDGQIDVTNVRPVRTQLGLHVGQRRLDLGDGQRIAYQFCGCRGLGCALHVCAGGDVTCSSADPTPRSIQRSGVRAWRSSTFNSSPLTVSFTTPIVAATGTARILNPHSLRAGRASLGRELMPSLAKALRCHQGAGLRIPGIRSPGGDGHDTGMTKSNAPEWRPEP
jgi:hypothetical protein